MAEITVLKIAPGKHPAKTKLQSTIEAFNRAVSVGAVEIGKACTKKMEKDIYIILKKVNLFMQWEVNGYVMMK